MKDSSNPTLPTPRAFRPPGLHRITARPDKWVDEAEGSVDDPAVLERLRRLAIPPAWVEVWASADPANHLAVLMADCTSSSGLPPKIASYTINPTTGSIASTNTWSDMPASAVNSNIPLNSLPPMFTDMSPSGELK